ncbi:hypothetical protein MRX96_038261 [Rhipicephalus microplus]
MVASGRILQGSKRGRGRQLGNVLHRKLLGQLFRQVRCLDRKVDGQGHHLVERPWHHQQAPGLGAVP